MPTAARCVTRANNRLQTSILAPAKEEPGSAQRSWHPIFWKTISCQTTSDIPLTKIETNSARAFATNAKADHIWDNFSSLTYKQLSPMDELDFFNPFDERTQSNSNRKRKMLRPGYYRTPSLISVWSSAPLLHNNMLGKFTGDPSVVGRMEAFNDAIEKAALAGEAQRPDSIWCTSQTLLAPYSQRICPLSVALPLRQRRVFQYRSDACRTPINLIANLEPSFCDMLTLFPRIKADLDKIR